MVHSQHDPLVFRRVEALTLELMHVVNDTKDAITLEQLSNIVEDRLYLDSPELAGGGAEGRREMVHRMVADIVSGQAYEDGLGLMDLDEDLSRDRAPESG